MLKLYGKYGTVTVTVTGLYVRDVLNTAARNGIGLTDVVREDYARVRLTLDRSKLPQLKKLLKKDSFRVTTVRRIGLKKLLKEKCLLAVGTVLITAALWAQSFYVSNLRLHDYENTALVTDLARECGVLNAFCPGSEAMENFKQKMREADPDILWLQAAVTGNDLEVFVHVASVLPEEAGGDIYAGKDGVVQNLICYSGTPLVQNGDTVFRGQKLIEGRMQIGDTALSVKADGKVYTGVWYYAFEDIPDRQTVSVPTGRRQTVREVTLFGQSVPAGMPEGSFALQRHCRIRLPFLTVTDVLCEERELLTCPVDRDEAIRQAEENLRLLLQGQIGDAPVCDQKTITEETDSGLRVGVSVKTIEDVAVRQQDG